MAQVYLIESIEKLNININEFVKWFNSFSEDELSHKCDYDENLIKFKNQCLIFIENLVSNNCMMNEDLHIDMCAINMVDEYIRNILKLKIKIIDLTDDNMLYLVSPHSYKNISW